MPSHIDKSELCSIQIGSEQYAFRNIDARRHEHWDVATWDIGIPGFGGVEERQLKPYEFHTAASRRAHCTDSGAGTRLPSRPNPSFGLAASKSNAFEEAMVSLRGVTLTGASHAPLRRPESVQLLAVWKRRAQALLPVKLKRQSLREQGAGSREQGAGSKE